MRLLIADDAMSIRIMLQALAIKWGFEPILAEDGHQAWSILSGEAPPRLVLLDWEMPGMSGLEICRQLRTIDSEDPPYLLLLTSRSETRDIVEGLGAGANDYVAKPFDSAELQARLMVGKRMLLLQAELLEAHRQLQHQATHDPLTGIFNRGAIMEGLGKQWTRAQREGGALCVGLCDVDHFKLVNDRYGHSAGDAVLIEVTRRLTQVLRPYDLLGRYGGEEFLMVAASREGDCLELFERSRRIVADTPFQYEQLSIAVTISIGVFEYTSSTDPEEVGAILNLADAALYKAKSAGRNRVILAGQ